MSCATRLSEGISTIPFDNTVALAVEQILTAHGIIPTRNNDLKLRNTYFGIA
jgi:hypothetical protein